MLYLRRRFFKCTAIAKTPATIAIPLATKLTISLAEANQDVPAAAMLTGAAASASYIVVPAVVRYAIPEANPSLYFTMSLAITFPFNIVIGIPMYLWLIESAW